jgi:hypothetical protein
MRYMFLIYSQEGAETTLSSEEKMEIMGAHRAVMVEASAKGVYVGASPLKNTDTATTVRKQEGKPLILDGPFAETKEQLAGYYILDCQNLDEAIEWAKKIPSRCKGGEGCVEIRPMIELPPLS